eukprot:snap_masked-scaffold_41-processed-gene-1.24-mRNA-1 protein AED:0.04 eAED:1.00 QI:0/-1/0/1/-1/1/1/0/653
MKAVFYGAVVAATSRVVSEASSSHMSPNGQVLMAKKENFWKQKVESGEFPRTELVSSFVPQTCNNTADVDGVVFVNGEAFPCKDVDFMSFIPLTDLFIEINGGTTVSSDIWGWEDTVTGQEYTLLMVDNGIWFIDTTDPANPVQVAYGPNPASKYSWGDVKVYKDVAYVVKDRSSENEFDETYGIQVWDLTRLRSIPAEDFPLEMEPDTVHAGHGKSHNIAVNTETGYAYSIGSNECAGGPYVLNLEPNPLEPVFETCVDGDGYTHDAQIVTYDGPDERFTGREILFAFNEDTLTIFDVTDKQNVERISRTGYPNAQYTHQGWLTGDMRWVFMNDELDEDEGVVNTTTTYIIDVADLRKPIFASTYTHRDVSIDHNLYDWGAIHAKGWGGSPPYAEGNYSFPPISNRFMYLSNYIAGIRILDLQGTPEVSEAGFFDIAPDLEGNIFEGTWSNYMHPSGNLAVSSIDRGFFVLRPRNEILYTDLVQTESPTIVPTAPTPPTVTPAPTVLPTAAPIVCEDTVPTGLVFSATGEPAECVDLGSYCTLEIVFTVCPVTCELCVPPTATPTGTPTETPTAFPTTLTPTNAPTDASAGSEDDLTVNEALTLVIFILLGIILILTVKILYSSCGGSGAVKAEERESELADAVVKGHYVKV